MIHEIVVAMHFRATAADLAAVPHYHPTLSEIWTYPAEELAGDRQMPMQAVRSRNFSKALTVRDGTRTNTPAC